jgi:hypothetical protein
MKQLTTEYILYTTYIYIYEWRCEAETRCMDEETDELNMSVSQ